MPSSSLQEHIYYHALNIATAAHYDFTAKLMGSFESFSDAWHNADRTSLRGSAKPATIEEFLKKKESVDPQKEWERLTGSGIALIMQTDPEYPDPLHEIPASPFGLYVRGALMPDADIIAVVGTRKAGEYGLRACRFIVEGFAAYPNVAVVSGLALGIDGVAHTACVDRNIPTFAVLGTGIDTIYPAIHRSLSEKILARGGAIISEYPPGVDVHKRFFPQRNRIVSGMSRGVIVVEAPQRSGSLITAHLALEQNRDVFVVPGSIFSKNYTGSHSLIGMGAKLVTSADDIAEEYGWEKREAPRHAEAHSSEQKTIIRALANTEAMLSAEDIIRETGFSARTVNRELPLMVLESIIKEANGKYYINK